MQTKPVLMSVLATLSLASLGLTLNTSAHARLPVEPIEANDVTAVTFDTAYIYVAYLGTLVKVDKRTMKVVGRAQL